MVPDNQNRTKNHARSLDKATQSPMDDYEITPFGLVNDTVNDVIVDRRIRLIQEHLNGKLYLSPIGVNKNPTIAEAWFYCDCIAYEHDIPAIIFPAKNEVKKFNYHYALADSKKTSADTLLRLE